MPGQLVDQFAPVDSALIRLASASTTDEVDAVLGRARELLGPQIAGMLDPVAELARDRVLAIQAMTAAHAEVAALQTVAQQVLIVRDLEQVLLSVANTVLRLLDADICGVLLLDDGMLTMRSCVGHRTVETAALRMRAGQGLAGRVLEHGRPWKVERYLQASDISRDFMSLAVKEGAEAALGVPLRADDRLIGVLEVWRRRESVFTDEDVVLLTALADLVSIAIGNADRYAEQARTVADLRGARRDLEEQVTHLRRSASLQRRLHDALVAGYDRPALARVIGEELHCSVVILSARGDTVATFPESLALPHLPTGRLLRPVAGAPPVVGLDVPQPHRPAFGQQVRAGEAVLGAICLLGCVEADPVVDLVLAQACSAYALHHLRELAASEARAKTKDDLVWDLVGEEREQRVAALDRADQHGLDLRQATRVLQGVVESADQAAGPRIRRELHRIVTRAPDRLGSNRGDTVVVIAPDGDRHTLLGFLHELTAGVQHVVPAATVRWGVSAACRTPHDLPLALHQAQAALTAGVRLRRRTPTLFDELGAVRVLFSDVAGTDLARFVRDTVGPLCDYDAQRDGALVRTLQAYFEADCSQREAAQAIPVHHKTLRYRLDRIQELTGLDLNRHPDRVRASIALELLHLASDDQAQPDNGDPHTPGTV